MYSLLVLSLRRALTDTETLSFLPTGCSQTPSTRPESSRQEIERHFSWEADQLKRNFLNMNTGLTFTKLSRSPHREPYFHKTHLHPQSV